MKSNLEGLQDTLDRVVRACGHWAEEKRIGPGAIRTSARWVTDGILVDFDSEGTDGCPPSYGRATPLWDNIREMEIRSKCPTMRDTLKEVTQYILNYAIHNEVHPDRVAAKVTWGMEGYALIHVIHMHRAGTRAYEPWL